jgi:hypothetical protein
MLKNALQNLPPTLDATYAQILLSIGPEYRSYAITLLHWLIYSARPLRLEEVVEVLAVESEPEPRFDPDNRFPEARDILRICSSLVTTVSATRQITGVGGVEVEDNVEELRLAHFSVQEYLVSDRVCREADFFRVQEASAHKLILETCLTYLLYFKELIDFTVDDLKEFPLAQYSAKYWMQHAQVVDEEYKTSQPRIQLLFFKDTTYRNWLRLYNPDTPWKRRPREDLQAAATPLYYVSLTGLYHTACQGILLVDGPTNRSPSSPCT